jgi:maltooligosyltrehalose trehalohydrolase
VTSFRVWAPYARGVELDLSGRRTPLRKQDRGWWGVEVEDAPPGTDYTFALDGGPPRPDPRSPWQPQGPEGPSRLVDHAAFRWTDERWSPPPFAEAVVYEMHVGTFSPEGTFDGAARRLDPLVHLGVTHVELMPVGEFPGRWGWGYDGVGLYAPHGPYGGPEGLKRFVDTCHARGLAVLLDVVYNHLGPSGNHLAEFGPYFTDRYATPWGRAVNLDSVESDEVRRFFCDNAVQWMRDYHVDGLRLDAVHALFDQSAVHFLEELRAETAALSRELGRPLVLVAESDLNDPRVVQDPAAGGYGIDAQWSDDFHHALHAALTGERDGYYAQYRGLADVAEALQKVFVHDGRYSAFRGRRHGRPVGDIPRHRFLAYLQNHDQVGNRAQGERSGQLLPPPILKAAAALVLLSPFVPLLFAGEEWGARTPFQYFTDHADPELGRAVREGRRKEFAAFGWRPEDVPDPQDPRTFERSKLDWSEVEKEPHRGLLEWHRELIRLRKATPLLARRDRRPTPVRFDEEARWLAFERGPLWVVCNLSDGCREVPLDRPRGRVVLTSGAAEVQDGALRLAPGAAILGHKRLPT